MRKTAAFFLSIFLVLALGYSTLHPAYTLIASWLGPVLGTSLLSMLTMIYLLMGDPVRFIGLGALWGVVSFLGGLIIRRRVGAVLTMLSVLSFLGLLLLTNTYSVVQTASTLMRGMEQENPLAVLPPLPTGLTIVHLFEAPIIGELIELALTAVQSGAMEDPMRLVFGMITPLLLGVALKFVIIVIAALVGVEVGKRLEPAFAPHTEALRARLGGKPRLDTGGTQKVEKRLRPFTVLLLIVSTAFFALPGGVGGAEEEYYSENLVGYTDETGKAYVVDLFVDSEASVGGVDWGGSGAEGLLGTVLISQEGIRGALPDIEGMGESLGSTLNLIPPTLMVVAYGEVPSEVALKRSGSISSAFSDAFGMDLYQMMAFNPPVMGENLTGMSDITFVVYQSSAGLPDMAGTYLDQFTGHGGLAEVMEEASTSGRLFPGATPDSADGTMLLSGFVDLEALSRYILVEDLPSNFTDFLPLDREGPLGFSGGASFWEHGVVTRGDEQTLDILGLLGIEREVSFSADSDMSILLLAAPNGTDVGGEEFPNVKLTTTLPMDDPRLRYIYEFLSMLGLINLASPGQVIEASSFQLTVSGLTLPLSVRVTKEASPMVTSPNGQVLVTVTVHNDDDDPMMDVSLDDGSTIAKYPTSARLVSGSTSGSWGSIGPGETRSISYTVRLGLGGVYSLAPALASYTHGEESYAESSDWLEVRVRQPNPLSIAIMSIRASWKAAADVLDLLTGGNGSTILLGSTLLCVAIIAVLEYRNLRKWLQG